MKQELIKPIVRVGNSAGIILPKEWLDGKARVVLIEKPVDIRRDVLEILKNYLEDIAGIYIVGSYARGEQTSESDADILVITYSTNKHIKSGKYDLLLVSEDVIKEKLENDAFPILPMLIEAKAILNQELIGKYAKTKLTGKNLKYIIDTTKSALNMVKEDIKSSLQLNQDASDASAYSLILRLRSLYIIDCIRKNKSWSKKEFLSMIKKTTGSLKAYEGYVHVKNDKKADYKLPVKDAENLSELVDKKLKEIEKWLKEKKE